jgi:hypothetical protein
MLTNPGSPAMSKLTRVLLALVAALLLLPLTGCEDKITSDSFDQIKTGWTIHEVEHLLGGKGEMIDRGGMSVTGGGIATGSGQSSQQLYEWRKGNKLISVTCVDGKVVDKGKQGL